MPFGFSLVLFQPMLVEYCWCAPGVGAFLCGAVYQRAIIQSISSLENGQ
jgi:ABC-type antimicrobial peptide transport system permease subunit